jgi:phosphoribosylformylglycinamidine synthase PurS subunit
MKLRARVYVRPRDGVLDPQGKAVERSLRSLGFAGVEGVRVGKYLELELEAGSKGEAEQSLRSMCERLLANPVIEDYRFELDET